MEKRLHPAPAAILAVLAAFAVPALAADRPLEKRPVSIRAGNGMTIVGIAPNPNAPDLRAALRDYPYPQPRVFGFSPLVAITTSDEAKPVGNLELAHTLESGYVGSALNPPANVNYVIGLADSGSDVELAAGSSATRLGLSGAYLTQNTLPLGGVGGTLDAYLTWPLGVFAAGLGAVNPDESLDLADVVGHSNVVALAAPPIECSNGESVTATIGMPLLAFYTTVVRVDTPREVTVGGVTYKSPDVTIQDPLDPIPTITHSIGLSVEGPSPVTTASYFPDFFDLTTPFIPTLLSAADGDLPLGASFFADINARQGDPATNPLVPLHVLADSGAQSSIISEATAANLSLPLQPDFTVDVCGVGGLVEDVAGYYVDYVRISALGGALEYSRVPFIVLDVQGSDGTVLDGILGMNFFWNRNVVLEASLTSSAFLSVSDPLPIAYGDFDVDTDVDEDDLVYFESCFAGADQQLLAPDCDFVDVNGDSTIDMADFAVFQECYSGHGVAATPNCGY